MRRWFLLFCFASLFFLLIGCGQDSSSSPNDLPEIELFSSEGDAGSSSSEKISSSSEETAGSSSSSSQKNTSNLSHSYGKLLDERDSAVYKTVTIGGLTWMAENLNYETDYSYCFADLPENCQKYGRLYLWGTAMDSVGEFSKNARGCGFRSSCKATDPIRGICPEGWHLPSEEEMLILFTSAGGRSIAGKVLKSTYDWALDGNGEDLLGFSALPAGLRSYENEYMNIGFYSYFWTTDRKYSDNTDLAEFRYDCYEAERISYTKMGALPVRCVQDYTREEPSESSSSSGSGVDYGEFTDSRDDQTYKTIVVGEKVWMAQNLNYECKKSYCYDNSFEKCDRYGRFYDWSMAQEICPNGWHLPDTAEWNALFDFVGGNVHAGTKLKALSAWPKGYHGKDICGFAALPGGRRDSSGAFIDGATNYSGLVEYAHFWTSEDFMEDYGYSVYVASDLEYAGFTFYYKNDYRSVRCVRDEPASSSSKKVSSSSSSVIAISSSSSSFKSSSSHFCDERAGFTCEDSYIWMTKNGEQTIYRYNGDTTEIIPAGRFHIIMNCTLGVEERALLAENGFIKVGTEQPHREKDYILYSSVLYSSESDTKKAFLDSILPCFFNAVEADDTSRIDVEILPEDISADSTVTMYIFCWGDVDVNECVETVADCGGEDIGIDRSFLVSTIPVDSVECLATSRNIEGLEVEREMPVCSPPLPGDL